MPRVQRRLPTAGWDTVWRRVSSRTLPLRVRAAWYRAVQDILPTNSRLTATRQAEDAACGSCGAEDTVLHRLTSCQAVSRAIWAWTATTLTALIEADETALTPALLLVSDVAVRDRTAEDQCARLLGAVACYLVENKSHKLSGIESFISQLERT
ncbi:hypothetical protein ONE63_009584 [Megalurothrips usitatus]|uniref:Reverse transcriptase zinc-binding domain-containing protein n=1 Tax=Megalurothrips usitatus TaxID=439358 RepID=A0AAV7XK34_9NEOP|nr:hypothetical protein ONE63_009584 [Megalurothrips usitatus]